MRSCYRLALSPGEPAGIGPDITVMLAQQSLPLELVAFADSELLQQRAKQLNLPLELLPYQAHHAAKPQRAGQLRVCSLPLTTPVVAGTLNSHNSSYVIDSLKAATSSCMQKHCDALITGPVHKGIINDAGIAFTGHTELLAELSNTPQVVMMLAHDRMRVALVTTHLPLSKVSEAITSLRLRTTIEILQHCLQQQFAIIKPRILVCGLNPHAGEDGYLGLEEQQIIQPLLHEMRQSGMTLIGPIPADTAFTRENLQQCDVVLAMYHDQGLPVLKHSGFGQAVNITLGLPFIRTSVDHGTALSLAGTGQAKADSLRYVLDITCQLVSQSQQQAIQYNA